MNHHENTRVNVLGRQEVVRPQVLLSRLEQWKRRRECRREFGHCWHPGGYVDWWCCACSADTEGIPAQNCRFCLAEEAGVRVVRTLEEVQKERPPLDWSK